MCNQQKNRTNFKSYIYQNPKFGVSLISNSNRRFEFVYFVFFRKWLKYFFKKAKKRKTSIRCYICLVGNYWVSKKTKNSRMGKGKGNLLRRCILIKKNQPILITSGINLAYLFPFKRLVEKKLNFRCSLQTNFAVIDSLIFSPRLCLLKAKKKLKI